MESEEDSRDPLDLEWLIEQAREVMKRWKKPNFDLPRAPVKPWQQLMDERLYKGGYKGS